MQATPGPSRLARWVALARTVGERADEHDADMVAAGLSFYALLGLFPGMLAVISIYGLVADPATVQSVLVSFAATLPPQARAVVNDALVAFVVRPSGDLTLRVVVGILAVLWSSSNGMGVLVRAINTASDIRERRNFFARRAVALLFTLSGVIGIAVVVPAVTAVPKILHRWHTDLPTLFASPVVLALAAFVALLVLFRYAPYKRQPFVRQVVPGAAAASIAWLLVSAGYSLYIRYLARLTSTYGALEGVVVLELWFYFSAIVLLYAAELNTVLRYRDSVNGPSSVPLSGVPLSRVPQSRPAASERAAQSTGE